MEAHDHDDDFDRGLQFDLSRMLGRRRLLGLFAGGVGAAALAACGATAAGGSTAATADGSNATTATTATSTATSTAATSATTATAATTATTGTLTETPEETEGPYPGDGSNGVNVLSESGIVRSDIRSSFGEHSGTAAGVPLTVTVKVVDQTGVAQPGRAVYVWHCTQDGAYSLYTLEDENYLRGVQATASDGTVTFTTIFPGCYDGRWPHIHYEVYPTLDEATSAANKEATSQIALPQDVCEVVYATDGYESSVRNLTRTSLATDGVFADSWQHELATVIGDVTNGYTATLTFVL